MNVLKPLTVAVALSAVTGITSFAMANGATPSPSTSRDATSSLAVKNTKPELSPKDLADLPLTERNLTARERSNLAVVLQAYAVAEGANLDVEAFIDGFASDGVFNDIVGGQTYQGRALGDVLNYMVGLFPDVHRELKSITVNGDDVSIELSIQGTFKGPLPTPAGNVKPTGGKVDVPTADFWRLEDGKIKQFNCYIGYSTMFAQMGVPIDWETAVAGN